MLRAAIIFKHFALTKIKINCDQ